jgi:hypothetical protein
MMNWRHARTIRNLRAAVAQYSLFFLAALEAGSACSKNLRKLVPAARPRLNLDGRPRSQLLCPMGICRVL